MEVPQGQTDQDREQDSSPGLKTLNMNINIYYFTMRSFMIRVELPHIWKFTVNIDHDLKFCLKVKLVQRHEDGETWKLIVLKILRGFQSC